MAAANVVSTSGTIDTVVVAASMRIQPPRKPSRRKVIDMIAAKTGAKQELAESTLTWIQFLVEQARTAKYNPLHLIDEELESPEYKVLDRLFPHGQIPSRGSAGAMVSSLVLDPARGEFALTHDGPGADGVVRDCTVTVEVSAIR